MNPMQQDNLEPKRGWTAGRTLGLAGFLLGIGLVFLFSGVGRLDSAAIATHYLFLQPMALAFGVVVAIVGAYYLIRG
jgi:hypothetical protein